MSRSSSGASSQCPGCSICLNNDQVSNQPQYQSQAYQSCSCSACQNSQNQNFNQKFQNQNAQNVSFPERGFQMQNVRNPIELSSSGLKQDERKSAERKPLTKLNERGKQNVSFFALFKKKEKWKKIWPR